MRRFLWLPLVLLLPTWALGADEFIWPMNGKVVSVGSCATGPLKGCSVDMQPLGDREVVCVTRAGVVTWTEGPGHGWTARVRHRWGYSTTYYGRWFRPMEQWPSWWYVRNGATVTRGTPLGFVNASLTKPLHLRVERRGTRLWVPELAVGSLVRQTARVWVPTR